ncbi:MAG: hypothetical protein IJL07_03330 [Lachnospiraceae bacterium]|nr:hypothetical protein [Lachnospiraceae bacterium]MBQ6090282.1 hypothetical protein [Lachnospiraceae bacterium]MBR5368475.1 hypothetical protein [Lachnospiraceae bacterium]
MEKKKKKPPIALIILVLSALTFLILLFTYLHDVNENKPKTVSLREEYQKELLENKEADS